MDITRHNTYLTFLWRNDTWTVTKVIVQGITGSTARFHTKQMLEYGTKIVAGVSILILKAILLAWKGINPVTGSITSLKIFSGVLAATSSISVPPSSEAINTTLEVARSKLAG